MSIESFYTDDITIQRRTEQSVSGEVVVVYVDKLRTVGKVRNVAGNERQGVNKTIAECDTRIYTYPEDIEVTDRILWQGRYFDIYNVNNVMQMNGHLQIDAREIK